MKANATTLGSRMTAPPVPEQAEETLEGHWSQGVANGSFRPIADIGGPRL